MRDPEFWCELGCLFLNILGWIVGPWLLLTGIFGVFVGIFSLNPTIRALVYSPTYQATKFLFSDVEEDK